MPLQEERSYRELRPTNILLLAEQSTPARKPFSAGCKNEYGNQPSNPTASQIFF